MNATKKDTHKRGDDGKIYKNIMGNAVDFRRKYNDWVYIVKHPFIDDLYKIGSTCHVWERLRAIIGHMGGDFVSTIKCHNKIYKEFMEMDYELDPNYFQVFPIMTYKYHMDNDDTAFEVQSIEIEKHIHEMMKDKRRNGEWFELCKDDIIAIDEEIIICDYAGYIDLVEMVEDDISDRSVSVERLKYLLK
jgi:hypothetical protein